MFLRRSQTVESETSLLQRAVDWRQHSTLESLDGEALRQITREQGVDFAMALLFDRFCESPHHAEFIRRIDALRKSLAPLPNIKGVKVVIVPGALYVERPDLGGDGQLVREVASGFGCETALIPLASFGSVATNARIIGDWLRQNSREQLVLVSLSKGGADLKLALASSGLAEAFRNVMAWVNVCGPLNGSRLANWILSSRMRTWFVRAKCHWQRRDFQFVTDLRHGTGGPLNSPLRVPDTMKLFHLVGFPLHQHMTSCFSCFCHRTLSIAGPNDGTTSLSDVRDWPGQVYPVWGLDHYFRPESTARDLIAALLRHLADELVAPRDGHFSPPARMV